MEKTAPPKTRPAKSLAGGSLAIARVLADRDGATFRSDGTCMYPTIRPGDVLRIQSRDAAKVRIGEIAVCRRSTHLFSHRVVSLGVEGERAYIVTRPDRVTRGDDPPTFSEDLLGVVVDVERRGRSVPLGRAVHPPATRLWYALCLKLIEVRLRGRLWWSKHLPRVQATRLYRRLAGTWFRLARPDVSYKVRLPMPALGDAVYRQMAPEEFDGETDWRGRPVQRWMLTVHINGAPQPAAWMTFARGAADGWSVAESYVQARYRGAGLEDNLLSRAGGILPPGPDGGRIDRRSAGSADV